MLAKELNRNRKLCTLFWPVFLPLLALSLPSLPNQFCPQWLVFGGSAWSCGCSCLAENRRVGSAQESQFF